MASEVREPSVVVVPWPRISPLVAASLGRSFRVSLRYSAPSARPMLPPGRANLAGSSVDALVSMNFSVEVALRVFSTRSESRTASLFCVKSSRL